MLKNRNYPSKYKVGKKGQKVLKFKAELMLNCFKVAKLLYH